MKILILIVLGLLTLSFWTWMGIILRDKGYEEKEKFHNHLWDIPAMFIVVFSTADKKLRRKYGSILGVCVLSLVGFFACGFYILGSREDYRCRRFKMHLDHEVYGLVIEKYKDKDNRNWETVKIKNKEGEMENELETLLYHPGLYDIIIPGDSIVKIKGSRVTTLYQGDSTRIFRAKEDKDCNNNAP